MTERAPTLPHGRVFLVDLILLVLGGFSALMLFSFGGQVMVAPVLLPVQWIVARTTTGWASTGFSILGSLLLAEVIWLGLVLLVGENPAVAVPVGLPLAILAGVVFFRTSRP